MEPASVSQTVAVHRVVPAVALALFVGVPAPLVAQESGGETSDTEETEEAEVDAEEATGESDIEKGTARQVLELLRQGKEAYQSGDFEAAQKKFKEAYETWPRPEIQVRIAKTAEKLGRPDEALTNYREYLDKRPEGEMAEDVREEIDRLEEKYAVTVKFRSEPDGADVFRESIDGEKLGTTPFEASFDPGSVTVAIDKPGYEPETRTIDLTVGEVNRVEFDLEQRRLSESDLTRGEPTDESEDARTTAGPGGAWMWGTGIVGLAGIGTGVVFTILQQGAESEIDEFDRGAPGTTREDLEGLRQKALGRHRASVIAYSAGGALTAVGLGMLFQRMAGGSSKGEQAGVEVDIEAGPGRAGASLELDFK